MAVMTQGLIDPVVGLGEETLSFRPVLSPDPKRQRAISSSLGRKTRNFRSVPRLTQLLIPTNISRTAQNADA
jgi:hypothetical protein